MFERLKKALSREPRPATVDEGPPSSMLQAPASEWASMHGFAVSTLGTGAMVFSSEVAGKPWRMEMGKPTRNYIKGEELRARAELGLSEDLAAMIINRPLKEALERKAYSMITDTLQTTADPNLPEEMRWLAMYDEVGWDSLPAAFWSRYSVLTDNREHAMAWIDESLAEMMLDWPKPAPSSQVPFMVLILRGKAYLRMEYETPDLSVLQHASAIFTQACESAIGAFGGLPTR